MKEVNPNPSEPLRFVDLLEQQGALGPALQSAISRVLSHGQFVLGPEVDELERELASFTGASHVVSCANGTDALALVLRAQGLGKNQAVLCPSFTFAATAEVIAWFATPVFVDVLPDTFNLDPASLEPGIQRARQLGLEPVGVIVVDLFGQPADYEAIEPLCRKHGMWMLCDAAQSFGASYRSRPVGTMGLATATSFFPAKPLGCYGDGGAVFTADANLAAMLRSLRMHGCGEHKYDNVAIGMNSRLDTIQAAVLLEKLKIFRRECAERNRIAERYSRGLADVASVPKLCDGNTSVWAQYTLRVDPGKRDRLASALNEQGIPTAIYYKKPLHVQEAYCGFPVAGNGLPTTERIAAEVISLPMHPYLTEETIDFIVAAVRRELASS
jgi:dTDP-4-amino-4,6-dideoxygalactose transaminase